MFLMIRSKAALLSAIAIFILAAVGRAEGQAAEPESRSKPSSIYTVKKIQWDHAADTPFLRISGDSPPTYTAYELVDPPRVIVDIANAAIAKSVTLPLTSLKGPVKQVKGQVLDKKEPPLVRLEIFLAADSGYDADKDRNDIVVKFAQKAAASSSGAPAAGQATMIKKIDVGKTSDTIRIHVRADGPINSYKKEELPAAVDAGHPKRMYIDIPNVTLPDMITIDTVDSPALARIRTARRDDGVRIVFDSGLDTLFAYDITTQPDGLMVSIKESAAVSEVWADILAESDSAALPDNPAGELDSANAVSRSSSAADDEFAFAGYRKKRLTVDFFKIDLHNVFRLFGEISEQNIVVDESVGGTLTLALKNVPWDFALDIILNLKNLQKEEQYNTIVISSKSKNFTWPKRASSSVEFKAEEKKVQVKKGAPRDPLSVKNRLKTSRGVVEANALLRQAQKREQEQDYDEALSLYEAAFKKWPENTLLAKRIASLCLMHLNLPEKALHYSKAALNMDGKDHEAALHAAIALTNLNRRKAAKRYFDISISGRLPSKEALINYAIFSEENSSYDAALSLLKKQKQLYGDSLTTMINRARILDKKGDNAKAVDEYRAILISGHDVPSDLERYIRGRLALANQ